MEFEANFDMQKKFIFLLLITVLSFKSVACEICGCGNGTFYMGLLPQFNKGFIETRYSYFTFNSKVAGSSSQFSNSRFQAAELWGGYNVLKNLQILAVIPYRMNLDESHNGSKEHKGLGDITLMANYKVLEIKKFSDKNSLGHQVWLGGGIKLATGDSKVDLLNPDNNIGTFNSKLGTGSLDYILNGMYKFSKNNFGIVASAQYKINGENVDKFRFGNRIYANSFAFYRIKLAENIKLAPNVGLLYENSERNYLNNQKVSSSGGYMTSAAVGIEINVKNVGFGYNFQAPISQDFSNGQTTANARHGVHLTYSF